MINKNLYIVLLITICFFNYQSANAQCSANFDGAESSCNGDIVFGANCSLDIPSAGNTAHFEIFYETNGTGGSGIIDATSGYTTGADILSNLNSGMAGEVVFFGSPGDCSGVTSVFSNFSCSPFTLDVYLSTIEYNAAGNPAAVNVSCAVQTITLMFNPEQNSVTLLETPGDCDNPATAIVGFDNGDGAGGAADGDLDDPEDFICASFSSAVVSSLPCGDGTTNSEAIPTVSAADLAANVFGGADASCYTDMSFTANAECPAEACPVIDPSIPTMGEWGLISLTILLAIFGIVAIKERQLAFE